MRKTQKAQLLEILQTLREAHGTIEKCMEGGRPETAFALLADCQQAAIDLGGVIEESEGEDCAAVRTLEEYCEVLYQIAQGLPDAITAQKASKLLRRCRIRVENSLNWDIPVRLEVVFFPYKASMWDSMESVWRAADADPNCDAYVVPIPYYDRNKDGSFGQQHYEGQDFPEDVPIVSYQTYSLEQRRPDVAYIHNPYDQNNYVTSVDPAFYSHEIKKHAECLVYIPYYATAGGMSEAQRSCPAYYRADYIVTQSERHRGFFDRNLPGEKFLPFGSPKFDRTIRACENPPAPPLAWQAKMAGKKVYFYNTSVGGMLADTDAFLKKMQYVFRCFEHRHDACLLWRPHPLLESTFASMRPQFLDSYREIKRRFLETGLGIYDDTPDITEAIALSDAYIGDSGTSVTALFGIVGKPLFILNNCLEDAPGADDWRGEVIKPFFPYRDCSWMVTQGNQLYHAPDGDYRYRHCGSLSESAVSQYGAVITVNKKTFLCPVHAQEIPVMENGVLTRLPL